MFGDLLGNMEEKQKEMDKKLKTMMVYAEAGDGAIKITANAANEITNIAINKDALDWDDVEQVEDLMMVAVNRVIEVATQKQAEESQKLMKDMMPPGLGGLGDLFGA